MSRSHTGYAQLAGPPRWMTALELRAWGERASMIAMKPLLDRLPRGDGHDVYVLPGFTADDRSTGPLRSLLDRLGYRTHGWGLGPNLGPTTDIVEGIQHTVQDILRRAEHVSIVGWSLGGIYGRELARRFPDHVRQVIAMGSPIDMVGTDPSPTRPMWEALEHLHETSILRSIPESELPLLPVPTTSIYTRTDGIVNWRTCLVRESATTENVEVHGSHCGLGFNPSVAFVVADRLAQPDNDWKKFRPPLHLRTVFPRPASWRPRTPQPAAE